MDRGIRNLIVITLGIVVGYFVLRWAYTEYYITTHCTEVLGTRVCQ